MGKIKKVKETNIKSAKNKIIKSNTQTTTATATTLNKKSSKTKDKILFSKISGPKKIINKKEKLKIKKKDLLKKIHEIKKLEKEEIARKKREKTVITGDLNPLKDALPSLDELLKLKPIEIKTGFEKNQNSNQNNDDTKKLSKTKKIKKRKKEFMNRYNCFQTLLKDPDYKSNPRETIAFHIRHINNIET